VRARIAASAFADTREALARRDLIDYAGVRRSSFPVLRELFAGVPGAPFGNRTSERGAAVAGGEL